MDEHEQKAIENIEKFGCHILHVMEEDEYPSFCYSIGIEHTTKHPDLIVIGLNQEIAHWVINEYCNRAKKGEEFHPNQFYEDFLEGYKVTFIEVDKKHYKEYLGWGRWYNKGDGFKMLQMVYPTTSNIWPWDKNAPENFSQFQPLLNAS